MSKKIALLYNVALSCGVAWRGPGFIRASAWPPAEHARDVTGQPVSFKAKLYREAVLPTCREFMSASKLAVTDRIASPPDRRMIDRTAIEHIQQTAVLGVAK